MKTRHTVNKLLTLLVFFCLLLVYVSPALSIQRTKAKNNFLWVTDSGHNTVYFLGSMHILKNTSYPLSMEIENAYKHSKHIVFETNIDEMSSPSAQQRVMLLGLYPENKTLMQNLSSTTQELLQKKTQQIGLPITSLNKFKPWLCAITLTVMEFQRLGFDPKFGIDRYFFRKAQNDNKKTIFLETADFQIDLMAGLSANEQERMLCQTLKDLEIIGKHASEMEEAWKSGDDGKLNSILAQAFKEYPKIYDRFIINRNKTWIPKIEKMMGQKENTLIIVGAGHLVGPESVLVLLKNKGYKIRQISSEIN